MGFVQANVVKKINMNGQWVPQHRFQLVVKHYVLE